MDYIEPKAIIIDAKKKGTVSKITIKLDRYISEPLAPAGLYSIAKTQIEKYQLHNIIKRKNQILTFETYSSNHSLPHKGELYIYRPWWTPEALEAVLDINIAWKKRTYTNNSDHDHCLFTWKEISAHNKGYYSDKYGWITVESYNNFIKNDIYNIRNSLRNRASKGKA